jgi:parallel beta helix pectate lyase-like protein
MARPTPRWSLWMALGALLTLVSLAEAKTWTVFPDGSGAVPTLQAGIAAAADGDIVLAMPGIYYENLDFMGKRIQVLGSGAETTVLNAAGRGTSAVTFAHGETGDAILEGFTITGGAGTLQNGVRYGGGVFIQDASPTVRNNRVVGNLMVGSEPAYGGGIYCGTGAAQAASPVIENNVFEENIVNAGGGGVAIGDYASPSLRLCGLSRNEAAQGGAIWFAGAHANPSIDQNTIESNLAETLGGGLYGSDAANAVLVSGNLFASNVARGAEMNGGGAIYLERASSELRGNTLVRNREQGPDLEWGGSLVLNACMNVVVEKNLFAFSESGGAIRCAASSLSIRNNLIWQNAGDEAVGDCANWWETDGNVSENPELCGMDSGDYRPASGSPALLHPAGPVGAYSDPGCGPVSTQEITWGGLKARYASSYGKPRN